MHKYRKTWGLLGRRNVTEGLGVVVDDKLHRRRRCSAFTQKNATIY